MTTSLRFHPEIEHDLRVAIDWYADLSPGLASRFCAEVDHAFDLIANNPELSGVLFDDVRAAQLRRFPYIVLYRLELGVARLLGVFHASMDPATMRSRSRS